MKNNQQDAQMEGAAQMRGIDDERVSAELMYSPAREESNLAARIAAIRSRSNAGDYYIAGFVFPAKDVAFLLDALATAQAVQPSPWQPIETAPKDGRRVLVMWEYWSSEPFVAYFKYGRWNGEVALSEGSDDGPTHWMPLPEAPHV